MKIKTEDIINLIEDIKRGENVWKRELKNGNMDDFIQGIIYGYSKIREDLEKLTKGELT